MSDKVIRVWHHPVHVPGMGLVDHYEIGGDVLEMYEVLPSATTHGLHYVAIKFKGNRYTRVFDIISIEYAEDQKEFNRMSTKNRIDLPKR